MYPEVLKLKDDKRPVVFALGRGRPREIQAMKLLHTLHICERDHDALSRRAP